MTQRRDLLQALALAGSGLGAWPRHVFAADAPKALAIGANVGVVDWAPSPFVDVVKSSRGFGRPDEWAENLGLARDAQGWPLEPSRIAITAAADRPGTEWPTGTWKGRFRGKGNLVPSAIGNGRIENVERRGDAVTFDWVVTGTPMLSLAFDGPIRDLKIVRPGHDLDKHPLLHDDALNYYKQFHTLRVMDFMGQNDTDADSEASWSKRQAAGKWHGRKSWEAMLDFVEAIYKAPGSRLRGLWWTVPFRFGEDDCLQLGRLLASRLPAEMLKFSEFSNELWNSVYGAKWQHFLGRANNRDDADYAIVSTPSTDQWRRMARLWGLQVARMARAMKTAFPDQFGRTLFPVMAGQCHGIHWHADEILPWLSQPPQVAAFGGLPRTYVGSLSPAVYLGGSQKELTEAADADAMLKGLRDGFEYSLARTRPVLRQWKQLQQKHGIARLDAYEWQFHTEGDSNPKVKMAAALDPAAGGLIEDMAHAMRDDGFQLACFLTAMPLAPIQQYVTSFLWPLNGSFGGARSAKGRAVERLLAEGQP